MTSLNMLNSRGYDTRGSEILPMLTNFNQNNDGFLITDPRPPEYVHTVHKKTVKELLMMRRQKLNCSQDDNNFVHTFKCAKSEAFPNDLSPHLLGPSGPVNSNIMNNVPHASPENGHIAPQEHLQNLPLQGQVALTAEVKMTLFHCCLHIAVAQGRRPLAYGLATKMAQCGSLDTKEHNGQTALQIAAATNQQFIVQDLLAHGAQINTRDVWGRSPLHVCAEKGHFSSLQSIWRTLMGTGQPIDIEMFNYDGLTPLHAAVLSHNAVVKDMRSLVKICSFMAKELEQRSQKYVECIKTLLLMGASCGTKDLKSGRTCLHMASEEANVELLNIFLDQPSSLYVVNVKTFSGNTALHIVSSLQNHKTQVEAVKLLMRKGADPGSRNFENDLPSQLVPEGPVGLKVRQILKGKYFHA
ncbi:NF-kappa-B inhibitor zeta isoform X2 [Sander vitreus]